LLVQLPQGVNTLAKSEIQILAVKSKWLTEVEQLTTITIWIKKFGQCVRTFYREIFIFTTLCG